jgi:hypothetical protein
MSFVRNFWLDRRPFVIGKFEATGDMNPHLRSDLKLINS